MKRLTVLAFIGLAAFGQSAPPKSVYVMAMSGGLDQYLAGWLTREHIVQVVSDPKIAEAVLTDTLGESFEQRLGQLQAHETAAEKGKTDLKDEAVPHPMFHSGSSRGTVFLVDVKTHHVLWSDYEKLRGARSSGNLNRTARRIAGKLHGSFAR